MENTEYLKNLNQHYEDWIGNYGGTEHDEGICIAQSLDGNLVLGGYAASEDVDVSLNRGGFDWWLLEIDAPIEAPEPPNTGIENRSLLSSVRALPNPSNGNLQLVLPSGHTFTQLTVVNALGAVVRKQGIGSGLLQLSDLAPGSYCAVLQGSVATVETVRFVVR